MSESELIELMVKYFEHEIVQKHQDNLLKNHSRLDNYQINPILLKYLSQLKENEITNEGIAKALFYPRALGTSITGSFGAKFQKMLVNLGLAEGSLIPGIDIEYIDKIEKRKKYCQLKSGPNTINSKDVNPMLNEFDKVANLARANSFRDFNNNDLVVGIMYGERNQLSAHYLKIDKRYPVYIGQNFWHRVTGYSNLYFNLIQDIDQLISKLPAGKAFQNAYQKLLSEIKLAKLI